MKYSSQVVGGEFCAWEDHPHFKYTQPSVIVLYGDRLWNQDVASYDVDYQRKMTRNILGVHTPKDFNIFRYLGDVLPPRDDKRQAYIERIESDRRELVKAKEVLNEMAGSNTYASYMARVYIDCIDWVLENKKD